MGNGLKRVGSAVSRAAGGTPLPGAAPVLRTDLSGSCAPLPSPTTTALGDRPQVKVLRRFCDQYVPRRDGNDLFHFYRLLLPVSALPARLLPGWGAGTIRGCRCPMGRLGWGPEFPYPARARIAAEGGICPTV